MRDHLSVSNESNSSEKITFKCKWCEYSSLNYLLYTTHKKNHTHRIYECDYDCKESFESKRKLIEHCQLSHHNQLKSIKCNKCSMEFPLNILLFDHSLSHVKESEQYVCPECGKILYGRRAEEVHRYVHLDKTFECSKCPSKFKSKKELDNHTTNVHSSKKVTCDICNKVYRSNNTLKKHKGKFKILNIS